MIIGIVLVTLNQFCGCFAMINYTATIFKDSGSNLSPNMSAIVVGTIQLIGAYCSTVLVDRAGRKVNQFIMIDFFPLLIISNFWLLSVLIDCVSVWNCIRIDFIGNICNAEITWL